jgi:hypothetical protein
VQDRGGGQRDQQHRVVSASIHTGTVRTQVQAPRGGCLKGLSRSEAGRLELDPADSDRVPELDLFGQKIKPDITFVVGAVDLDELERTVGALLDDPASAERSSIGSATTSRGSVVSSGRTSFSRPGSPELGLVAASSARGGRGQSCFGRLTKRRAPGE